MLTILLTILPVFALIFLGVLLRKTGFLDAAMESAANKLAYWVCLPAFIVMRMGLAPRIDLEALRSGAALILVTFAMMVLGIILLLVLRLPRRSRGTFLHAGFRGNLAYIGIPVIIFALGEAPEAEILRAESLAVVTMTPVVLLYNLMGVMVLEWDRRHAHETHPLRAFTRSTLRNPLVIACVVGLVWNLTELPFPGLFERVASPLAAAAFPLALLAIGARIASLPLGHQFRANLGVCLVKNFLPLPMAWFVCEWLGVDPTTRLVVMVLSVVPTAVASYVLVDQLDGDRDLGASAIAATTLASIASLSLALWVG